MKKVVSESRLDWTALVTFLASAGVLLIGILLNSVSVSNAFKAALLLGLFAGAAGISAALAISRAIFSLQRNLDDRLEQSEKLLQDRIAEVENDAKQDLKAFRGDVVSSMQLVEHAVFEYLINRPGSESGKTRQITPVGLGDVIQIEERADEVWIYASDLLWESAENMFMRIMEANLNETIRYRYLVPDNEEVLPRVSAIQRRLQNVPNVSTLLSFRVRKEAYPLGILGFGIYNPTYELTKDEVAQLRSKPCMIQFPRLTASSDGANEEGTFVRYSGAIVHEYEAAFYRLWQSARPYQAPE